MRYQHTSYHLTREDAEKAKEAFLAHEHKRCTDPEAMIFDDVQLVTRDGKQVSGFKMDGFHWGAE